MSEDTAAIRAGEELPLGKLAEHLKGKLDHGGEIEARQFPGGHSNLTYQLTIGGNEYVLRRAPLGPVAPKAHDMVREARILEAVHPHFPLAPRVYMICEDASVLGVPFYLMERRHGVVVRTTMPEEFRDVGDFAPRVSRALVDTLAALHAVDVERHGLTGIGKPEGFLQRQVAGWTERWRRVEIEPSAEMDRVTKWLAATIPDSGPPAIVHNDYKLDNLMLDTEDPSRVVAVLDWEMTTVGDPMADLGLSLCYWVHVRSEDSKVTGLPAAEGWFTREEFLGRYAQQSGRELSHVGWHEVLGIFKLAVILQQIYYRYWKGQTRDERFKDFYSRVRGLTETAVERMDAVG